MFPIAALVLVQCINFVNSNSTSYSQARQNVFHQLEHNRWCSLYNPEICGSIPSDQMPDSSAWNIEHVLPQSWLAEHFGGKNNPEFNQARADLNHLFVSDSRTNSRRSNHPFANCGQEDTVCQSGYEPVDSAKGIVARAMLYASWQYDIELPVTLIETLKAWNSDYPVTSYELNRNDIAERIQSNRNYFIDRPEKVSACF
jgi:deoxyribonuclease I